MFWKLFSGIGALSFVTTGFGILFDSNCKSVDFSGGRAILASCRFDDSGLLPGPLAGLGSILVGFLIIYFFIPEVRIFLSNLQSNKPVQIATHKQTNRKENYRISEKISESSFEVKVCLDCKDRVPLSYDKCHICKGSNLEIRSTTLTNLAEVVTGERLPEFKVCPKCAEDIKYAAVKCKHCGSEI